MDVVLDEGKHSRSSLDKVFLFRTFRSLLMGRVEQEQGDGNISGKTIKTEHYDNEEEKNLQISFDFTINPTVKLELTGWGLTISMTILG